MDHCPTRDTRPADSEQRQRERLLQRAAAGDERAWRDLVDRYTARVFGLIRARCGDAELAEEVTQATFCTLVVKLDTYREIGRFESWLYRIAMNRLRDEMRARRRRRARLDDDGAVDAVPAPIGHIGPGGTMEADGPRLRRAMARLSDDERRLLSLRYVGQLTFTQIADIEAAPLGTVLARHHRTLRKLRRALETGARRAA